MNEIAELTLLLQILIPIAGGVRIMACCIYMSMDEDPTPYKRRIRNALIFIAVAECAGGVLSIALRYFGGGTGGLL